MKKLHLMLLIGAMAIGLNASAQFTNTTSHGSTSTGYSSETNSPTYDRFQVSYVNEKYSPDKGDDFSTNGVGVKWIHGISLSQNHPIYLQSGVDAHVGFWSDEKKLSGYSQNTYLNEKLTTLNVAVPVNLSYKFSVSPTFAIEPLVGLNVKFNILSKKKYSVDTEDEYLQEDIDDMNDDDFKDTFGVKKDINNFDKKDTGDKNTAWKRFQIGWHIGANFIFSNKYYAGITYGSDFMNIFKKANTSTLAVGVGYIF